MWSQILRTSEQELHGVPGEKDRVSGGDLDLVPLSCPPTYLCSLGFGGGGELWEKSERQLEPAGPLAPSHRGLGSQQHLRLVQPGGSRSLINLRLNGSEGGLWSQKQA